jgi:uncharacterized BrkB/YihY/UPF0761 family membrane protein
MSDLATAARRAAEPARDVASRGVGRFAGAVLLRFRAADGATHVRALAYQMTFVAISGFIGLVGLASALDFGALRRMATELGLSLAPGPSGELLRQSIRQGSSQGWTAALVGLTAATVGGTLALAQLERSANRIAGSNLDRPGIQRYVTAAVLAVTVGVLFAIGTLIAVGGSAIGAGLGWSGSAEDVWLFARWPFGAALILVATYLLYRHAPRERLGEHRTVLWGAVAFRRARAVLLAAVGQRPEPVRTAARRDRAAAVVDALLPRVPPRARDGVRAPRQAPAGRGRRRRTPRT